MINGTRHLRSIIRESVRASQTRATGDGKSSSMAMSSFMELPLGERPSIAGRRALRQAGRTRTEGCRASWSSSTSTGLRAVAVARSSPVPGLRA